MQKLGYRPALDGVRGVAILAVVAFHFFGLPGGFVGVDLFFVLSGFLITTLLLEERDAAGSISLRGFYRRRVRRLGPAFAVVAIVMLPQLVALAADGDAVGRWGLVGLLLVTNVVHAAGHAVPGTVTPLWSLAEEEQFYLVWPLVLIALLQRNVALRKVAVGLGAIACAVALWRLALVAGNANPVRVYFAPDAHSDGILAGCALALFRRDGRLPAVADRWAFVAASVLVAVMVFGRQGGYRYALGETCAVCAAVVLVAACAQGGRLADRVLKPRPVVLLGLISYPLYLWQGVVYSWAGKSFVTAVVAVVLAWLTWRWVERPIRRKRLRSSLVAPVTAVS